MTQTLAPVVKLGHWLMPWVFAVFASAAIAYAITTAAAAPPMAAQRLTTSPPIVTADLGPTVSPERCPPIGSGFMDTVITAEVRRAECQAKG